MLPVALWLATADPEPASTTLKDVFDIVGPIAGTGLVGIFLLMVLFRIKIMPTWVYDEARSEWAKAEARYIDDIEELKSTVRQANEVYTTQVIPALTRSLDVERELVELRRDEQAARRLRGGRDGPHV